MAEILLTRAEANDQPALHRLWETVFGDGPEIVQAFFDCYPPEVAGWVVRVSGEIRAAAYLLPGNWLIHGSDFLLTGYVYAVATAPEERKKGYAGKLMRYFADMAQQREMLLYTRPAECTLFQWYANTMDATHIGFMTERQIRKTDLSTALAIHSVSPETYGALREKQLEAVPHILLSERFLKLQARYVQQSGGLYAVGSGCCVCEKKPDGLYLSELLVPPLEWDAAVQTLLRHFECERCTVRIQNRDGAQPVAAFTGNAVPFVNWGLFLE